MPVINRVAALTDEITAWRRDFHQHPELLFAVDRTAGLVAERLRAFGCDEVVTGLGRTGVVGVIRGRTGSSGRTVGLRADMDALPIEEATAVPYRSTVPGKMHACGHDGHTAMLLGAAKYLAETRNFDGTAVMIFQPAEEGGGGGDAMVKDGLMERFGIQEVYGLHNKPGLPLGHFAIRPGPIMAAVDRFTITVEGRGGHAAQPQECIDTVLISAHIITALQSIVARNADPIASAVVSVTTMRAGEAFNVLPQTAVLNGTVRSLTEATRQLCEERIGALAAGIAAAFGATARTVYSRGYPVTDNHPEQAAFMADIAAEVAGEDGVNRAVDPMMGAEDFSYMLEQRPGAYIFLGTGEGPGLHHPAYDFNDAATPYGVSLWARLIERAMPA
ncbi:M20 aminoacylase family protein [Methylobacterium sp. ID0610]|uniref:M20 aminoacylase family protein n=1 Tax=Methylobacterium carpenticola TaxID=3344827 RepID=UPI00368F3705